MMIIISSKNPTLTATAIMVMELFPFLPLDVVVSPVGVKAKNNISYTMLYMLFLKYIALHVYRILD